MTARLVSTSALALALAFGLAACGSQSQEETTEAAVETAATEAGAAGVDAGETPGAEASETPDAEAGASPSPTPSASASTAPTPAASPSQVAAAAGPPDAFKQCAVCHKTTPGDNLIGPTLDSVFGAKAGHIAGFKYSPAMLASGLTWNQATLDRYLTDPKAVVPGTTMAFAGVKDDAKRKAIIDYLKTL